MHACHHVLSVADSVLLWASTEALHVTAILIISTLGKQEVKEMDTLSSNGCSVGVHHDGSLPPPMEYFACTFYINKERNSWVWHFNVTKKLDALIQVLLIPLML